MIELKQNKSPFAGQFENGLARSEPRWLRRIRTDAMGRFAALGFPTTHDEDWKYTSVAAIAATPFAPPPAAAAGLNSTLADIGCGVRLVFVNGRFSEDLSTVNAPAGITAGSMARHWARRDSLLESHLARYARFDEQAFVALNTALAEDGALVAVERGAVVEEPVLIVHLAAPGAAPTAIHPRNLILAGRGSRASVVELYIGPEGQAYLTNAVSEVVVSEEAVLDHYKIQAEGDRAFHVAAVQGVQDRAAVLRSHNFSLGAALTRNDVNSLLDAEGAECVLNGLYVASGRQHVDNHTALDHAKPNGASRELYKGILGGGSTGVFNGKIIVRQDAQKTNAIQSNRNLLVSGDAGVNTKPQLEIFADDVRCTHGATVGQLDEDALFYLRSRGIPAPAARDLLIQAFAEEVLDAIGWRPLRRRLTAELRRTLARLRQEEAAA